jgi:hypothetical protein
MNFLSYVREEVADGARDKFFTVDFVADIMAAVDRVIAERDEARRDVCHMMHWTGFLAGDYARSRGWDCFKDDKHEVSAEILNFRDIWSAYAHRLRDERDEARREICVMLEDATNDHRENHAKRWGWDCFKEDGK